MNELPDDLKEFVYGMIDEYADDQVRRFPVGVKKYGNHILDDYTIEEHIVNLKEEHRDADAYTYAIDIKVKQMQEEIKRLRSLVAELGGTL